ncbi:hypothetical protein PIB30_096217, partial [Stylosanthes scabra]|nr:hypothetical protein [Stylosanthes scabra]
ATLLPHFLSYFTIDASTSTTSLRPSPHAHSSFLSSSVGKIVFILKEREDHLLFATRDASSRSSSWQ